MFLHLREFYVSEEENGDREKFSIFLSLIFILKISELYERLCPERILKVQKTNENKEKENSCNSDQDLELNFGRKNQYPMLTPCCLWSHRYKNNLFV